MQTFLPFPSFADSAEVLDNKRLNKQRVECLQIYNVLTTPLAERKGWRNHPAVLMWVGHTNSLLSYWKFIEIECERRGFKRMAVPEHDPSLHTNYPKWLGDDRFHKSHRLNLMFKDPEYYSPYFNELTPTTKPDYFWPTKEGY